MKKKIIKGIVFVLILGFTTLSIINLNVRGEPNESLIKYSKSAVLIEVETGEVLYEYNANERLEPASMTKVMTMKLILDAINSKRITYEQELTTSEYASQMGGTQIFLSVGEKMKVKDLFKSMVIASANDAAVCLAEGISGSEKFFVNAMNDEVKKLGLNNTHFNNVTGLPTDNHYASCYDMAMIARNLLLKYEDTIIPYTSTYEDYVRNDSEKPFWLVNTNKLIKHVEGIDGLKTGWTETAGYCLTCTKKENGMRLISVVMNADTVPHRTTDTLSLLNYGFANFEKVVIIGKGTSIQENNNILLNPNKYNIITSGNVSKIVKKNEKLDNPRLNIFIDEKSITELKQYNIGYVEVYINDKLIGKTQLELEEKPTKNSFISLFLDIMRQIF